MWWMQNMWRTWIVLHCRCTQEIGQEVYILCRFWQSKNILFSMQNVWQTDGSGLVDLLWTSHSHQNINKHLCTRTRCSVFSVCSKTLIYLTCTGGCFWIGKIRGDTARKTHNQNKNPVIITVVYKHPLQFPFQELTLRLNLHPFWIPNQNYGLYGVSKSAFSAWLLYWIALQTVADD